MPKSHWTNSIHRHTLYYFWDCGWNMSTGIVCSNKSLFTHIHIVPSSYDCLLSVEHKRWIVEEYPGHYFQCDDSEWGLVLSKSKMTKRIIKSPYNSCSNIQILWNLTKALHWDHTGSCIHPSLCSWGSNEVVNELILNCSSELVIIRNIYWTPNQHIRMIEGSCDSEDWSNGCWNFIIICHHMNKLYLLFN